MKIWQWALCLVCPVCGSGEHTACHSTKAGEEKRIVQYHAERLKAGRALAEEMNEGQPIALRGAAKVHARYEFRELLRERDGPLAANKFLSYSGSREGVEEWSEGFGA